jgi:predicted phosphoadenosine phosphosulfate sulfurtransferase
LVLSASERKAGSYLRFHGKRNVVEAAKERILLLASTQKRLYISFSGGKDSLCLGGIIEELVEERKIDPKCLEFLFIDEEAMYPDVIDIIYDWRKKVLLWGAKFHWLCLPIRHYSCFNQLKQEEAFLCWDPSMEKHWVHKMPPFAIKDHSLFKWGMRYQEFLEQLRDGYHVIGVRASESVQRLFSFLNMANDGRSRKVFPIFDWKTTDVWKYIYDRNIKFPMVYIYMWKVGVPLSRLRISEFFAIDSSFSLVRMFELYPGLFEKVINREPNAYLALYYWDSEMFGRRTRRRKELEEGNEPADPEKEFWKIFPYIDNKVLFKTIKGIILQYKPFFTKESWRILHKAALVGDPKFRTVRTVFSTFKYDD